MMRKTLELMMQIPIETSSFQWTHASNCVHVYAFADVHIYIYTNIYIYIYMYVCMCAFVWVQCTNSILNRKDVCRQTRSAFIVTLLSLLLYCVYRKISYMLYSTHMHTHTHCPRAVFTYIHHFIPLSAQLHSSILFCHVEMHARSHAACARNFLKVCSFNFQTIDRKRDWETEMEKTVKRFIILLLKRIGNDPITIANGS